MRRISQQGFGIRLLPRQSRSGGDSFFSRRRGLPPGFAGGGRQTRFARRGAGFHRSRFVGLTAQIHHDFERARL